MNDITKLPKWAQSKILTLQNEVAQLTDQLSQIQHGGSDMRWHSILGGDDHGIPDDAIVVAKTGSGEIELSVRNRKLQVRCNGIPTVQPQAANWLIITVQDKW